MPVGQKVTLQGSRIPKFIKPSSALSKPGWGHRITPGFEIPLYLIFVNTVNIFAIVNSLRSNLVRIFVGFLQNFVIRFGVNLLVKTLESLQQGCLGST